MSTRDTAWPAGTPNWVDLSAPDISAARLFYEGLFGWTIEPGKPQFGGYANCYQDGRLVCGLVPTMQPEQPTAWTTYLAVDDAAAAMDQVRGNGGHVVAEPVDVMGLGTMAVALDPAGVPFGVWKAGTHTGFQVYNEAGTVVWNEHLAADFEAAKSFYGAVFGWTYNDMSGDGFEYATFQAADGHEAGGLGGAGSDGVLAPWMVYFAAEDTDAAVDQVVKLGGSLLRPPRDSPYGRLAAVADDQGAVFSLISEPAPQT